MDVSIDVNNAQTPVDTQVNNQQSVFSAAFPYGVGSLALAGGGTWVAVTQLATGGYALPIAGVVVALIGAYGFFATAVTAIYSRDSRQFNENIGPALKTVAFAVITEVIASVARAVLDKLINRALSGK